MPQRVAGIFDIPEHGGNDHDGQTNPEQNEESPEIPVFAPRIEMGDASFIVYGRKQPVFLLSTNLLSGRRGGLSGWRCVWGQRGGAATECKSGIRLSYRNNGIAYLETPDSWLCGPSCLEGFSSDWALSTLGFPGLSGRGRTMESLVAFATDNEDDEAMMKMESV